jgi:hypothetical protein
VKFSAENTLSIKLAFSFPVFTAELSVTVAAYQIGAEYKYTKYEHINN